MPTKLPEQVNGSLPWRAKQLDLLAGSPENAKRQRLRAAGEPQGYFARPGTGPAGKTCADCQHLARMPYQRAFAKCRRNIDNWTQQRRTDIDPESPACLGFDISPEAADPNR